MWSIRTRTAVAFALASMALAAAAITFADVMTLRSIGQEVAAADATRTSTAERPTLERDPTEPASGVVTLVAVVATQQWQWSVVGVAGTGVVAGGVGWVLSRRTLRPIDRITATADRISASNLRERIGLDGPDDELRRLSRTIDALIGRLETAFESQRRFVAQASHELRTPLAVQRAAIQIGLSEDLGPEAVDRVRDELLAQNRRTEHLVDSLLVLAEADRGLDGRLVDCGLPATAAEVVVAAADSAAEADVTVSLSTTAAPPGRTVRAEPVLVHQLLVNLVDNAVAYNVPGGTVTVVVDADGVTVENTGPVVAPQDVPALLEPFRRGADAARADAAGAEAAGADAAGADAGVVLGSGASRRHSGLGLSIVVAIVRAHGWRLDVGARPAGGLRVRVDVSPM